MDAPITPQTGDKSKVYLNVNDGIPATCIAMTLQEALDYEGETYEDRAYLLASDKSKMINNRPGITTKVLVDGIIDGLDVAPTTNDDEVSVSKGRIKVDGVTTSVSADAFVSVTRPASGEGAWVAISVNKSTGAITATKGTDTTGTAGKAGLLSTFGTGAGQKPLIATTDLLIRYIKLDNGAKAVEYSEIDATDIEFSAISFAVYPSYGMVLLATALKKLHTGGVAREVKFTGKYHDDTNLAEIGYTNGFNLDQASNTVSKNTTSGTVSQVTPGAYTETFEHLFTDPKTIAAVRSRQGYVACKLMLASGHFFRFVGTITTSLKVAVGSFDQVNVNCSSDYPYYSGDDE